MVTMIPIPQGFLRGSEVLIWAHHVLGMGRGGYIDRCPAMSLVAEAVPEPLLRPQPSPACQTVTFTPTQSKRCYSAVLRCNSFCTNGIYHPLCVALGLTPLHLYSDLTFSITVSNLELYTKHPCWPIFAYYCSSIEISTPLEAVSFLFFWFPIFYNHDRLHGWRNASPLGWG